MHPVRLPSEPPLVPDGAEARELLRRELARPEYHDSNLVERMLGWLGERLQGAASATTDSPVWMTVAALLILLGLAIAVLALVTRPRGEARARSAGSSVLGGDDGLTAAELRARAERALAEGRWSDALLEGFRALALRQIERGVVDDLPGATAHELADALAGQFPEHESGLGRAAWWFDLVCYGRRPATEEQAQRVLDLDDALSGRAVSR